MGDTWWWGCGRYPRRTRCSGESAGSAQLELNWHKNSDLGSEVSTVTDLNSTTRYPKESVALVTFEWNVLLNLSWRAATKTFCSLVMELLLQVLCQSTGTMTVWVICGDGGMGDIPGIWGVQGESAGSSQLTLDWHKNSDLGSEVGIVTGLNSTTLHLIESLMPLTK